MLTACCFIFSQAQPSQKKMKFSKIIIIYKLVQDLNQAKQQINYQACFSSCQIHADNYPVHFKHVDFKHASWFKILNVLNDLYGCEMFNKPKKLAKQTSAMLLINYKH